MATLTGAGSHRRPEDPLTAVRAALERAVTTGSDDPAVVATARRLRERLGRDPMNARARTAYAGLLLGCARSPAQYEAAAFHARRAATLAPVTVPVVRGASVVLAGCGDLRAARGLVRSLFTYAPAAAADHLLQVEPLLGDAAGVVPERPHAWLAWSRRLRREGREEEADEALGRAAARWPREPDLLLERASQAVRARDWQALARVFPEGLRLPETEASALLHAYRAHASAVRGDPASMRRDVETALRLGGRTSALLEKTGDALLAGGALEDARSHFAEALHRLPADAPVRSSVSVLLRLARLAEVQDRPDEALRRWTTVLRLDPAHTEARRRIAALTGRPAG